MKKKDNRVLEWFKNPDKEEYEDDLSEYSTEALRKEIEKRQNERRKMRHLDLLKYIQENSEHIVQSHVHYDGNISRPHEIRFIMSHKTGRK